MIGATGNCIRCPQFCHISSTNYFQIDRDRSCGMKILAVDDDPVILELLTEIVRSTKTHEIVTACSARQAVDLLTQDEHDDVDCFMLDIQMPGMDGIELCRVLRTCPHVPYKPIIMLTAMSEKRYIDAAFAAGANDYVTKPFEVFDVLRRIDLAEARARKIVHQAAMLANGAAAEAEKVGLMQPIFIFDVDNLVDYYSLENYVPMMSRRALFGAVSISFHIRRIAEIHESLSGPEFHGLIEDVAETISDEMRDHQYLMAYGGFGTFIWRDRRPRRS